MNPYELNWGQRIMLVAAGAILLSANMGCSFPLTPEVIQALAGDNASVCGRAGIRGGAGALPLAGAAVPVGGWGSSEIEFCRSNFPNATLSMTPDGAVTITHGAGVP